MSEKKPQTVLLKDYQAAPFVVEAYQLDFEIQKGYTIVTNEMVLSKNPKAEDSQIGVFNGEELELLGVTVNGTDLDENEYKKDDETLTLTFEKESNIVIFKTKIFPEKNKSLEGLYQSDAMLCTQMEPQGFRKVTYGLDRPDVLSKFKTRITADKKTYPFLLSNGNLIEKKDLENGRHSVLWEDPFKKPCYLFALVAADLGLVESTYMTKSGREVKLEVYVDKGNESRAHHAMESLKKAMKWDEDVFDLEYDLDLYMIVAVQAFNFGAMENKGLNIFNASAVLADSETATDAEFNRIENIVAHEYFHNWTGNRVTLRDWFQLTLKEGLTVYRDQEFSSDVGSRAVFRIDEVTQLRNGQFSEDSGPMSHPIQPEEYIEINNFYTHTVYNKGAEVIRMFCTIIGREKFIEAVKLYLKTHDGSAATTEDFVAAMSEVSGVDFTQFKNAWYKKAGTPHVNVSWDKKGSQLMLNFKQENKGEPSTHVIPVKLGLVTENGSEKSTEQVFLLDQTEKSLTLEGVGENVTPSLFRDFSAPVIINASYTQEDYLQLLKNDSDSFNKFSAMQSLIIDEINAIAKCIKNYEDLQVTDALKEAFVYVIQDSELDPAFKAHLMTAPNLAYILESSEEYNPELLNEAREFLLQQISSENETDLYTLYDSLETNSDLTQSAIGLRALKNACLSLMSAVTSEVCTQKLKKQYFESENMTLRFHAMELLCNTDSTAKAEVLKHFEETYKDESLVMNKWFKVQAMSKCSHTLDLVKALEKHPCYDTKNPNKFRSLIAGYASNLVHLHRNDGLSYSYLREKILEIDGFNAFMASGLAQSFSKLERLDETRKQLMTKELNLILNTPKLSKDTYEVVSKILKTS